jgi:hypothetical protein
MIFLQQIQVQERLIHALCTIYMLLDLTATKQKSLSKHKFNSH